MANRRSYSRTTGAVRAGTVFLIAETVTQDEIGQNITNETRRELFCDVGAITRTEWSTASQLGLKPEFVIMTPSINYEGEDLAEIDGVRYAIYRTYDDGERVELYLTKKVGA